jgi:hypothetical protein
VGVLGSREVDTLRMDTGVIATSPRLLLFMTPGAQLFPYVGRMLLINAIDPIRWRR